MPTPTTQLLLSPAELSYLHTSLSLHPPIRPDGRSATQFRPLTAEADILPSTNGSARVCFADGTEAIVGVKAEVERAHSAGIQAGAGPGSDKESKEKEGEKGGKNRRGEDAWVELTVDIPGFRDDDAVPVFLASVLLEALLVDGELTPRLYINRRFHWKLYIDILLLSPPLSYPLPLLSLTTYLALLATRLPRLKSELEEDPLFDDDWEAAPYLYPRGTDTRGYVRPPVTLLVMAVRESIIFDPSKEELAVADVVLAISVGEKSPGRSGKDDDDAMDIDAREMRELRLLSVRTVDPPSRLTPLGVPNFLNTATGGSAAQSAQQAEKLETEGVWQPPRGGAKRKTIAAMIRKVLEKGGPAEDILDGLDTVELG